MVSTHSVPALVDYAAQHKHFCFVVSTTVTSAEQAWMSRCFPGEIWSRSSFISLKANGIQLRAVITVRYFGIFISTLAVRIDFDI